MTTTRHLHRFMAPLIIMITSMSSLILEVHGQVIVDARYYSPIDYNIMYATSSSSEALMGSRGGVVLRFDENLVVTDTLRAPTLSTITSVEVHGNSIYAGTEDLQLFRYNGVDWEVLHSELNTKSLWMSTAHWAVESDSFLEVYAMGDGIAEPITRIPRAGRTVGSLSSAGDGMYCIGWSDGRVDILSNGDGLKETKSVALSTITFAEVVGEDEVIASTDSGTYQYGGSSSGVVKILPTAIKEKAFFGEDHYIVVDRRFTIADTVFYTVIVHDVGGATVYYAIVYRLADQSFNEVAVSEMSLNLRIGLGVYVAGKGRSLVSQANGEIQAYNQPQYTEVYENALNKQYLSLQQTLPSYSSDGTLAWVESYHSGVFDRPQVHRLCTINGLSDIQSSVFGPYECVETEFPAVGVRHTEDETLVSFQSGPSVQVNARDNSYDCRDDISFRRYWNNGSFVVAAYNTNISVSRDSGVTWQQKVHVTSTEPWSGLHIGDSTFVCVNMVTNAFSTLTVTTDMGTTWTTYTLDGTWGNVVGVVDEEVLVAYRPNGLKIEPLRVHLLAVNIRNGNSRVQLDTTFAFNGIVANGCQTSQGGLLITTGPAGILRLTKDFTRCIVDTTSVFRLPGMQSVGAMYTMGDTAWYVTNSGVVARIQPGGISSVEDGGDVISVRSVWPMPINDRMECRIQIPSPLDLPHATLKLYDSSGGLILDLTSELRTGSYQGGFAEFSVGDLGIPSGFYVLVATVGTTVSTTKIVVAR